MTPKRIVVRPKSGPIRIMGLDVVAFPGGRLPSTSGCTLDDGIIHEVKLFKIFDRYVEYREA